MSFDGGLKTDFFPGFGVFAGVAKVAFSSHPSRITFNVLSVSAAATSSSPCEWDFVTGFGRTSTLPFVGFGRIGLSRAGTFRDWTSTSLEAAVFLLLAVCCLGAAFGVGVWLFEAGGEG
jgi:hypothetical protein